MKLKDVLPNLQHVLAAIFKKMDNVAGNINFTNARQVAPATQGEAYSGHRKDMQNVIGSLNGLNFLFNEFRSACVNFGNNTTSAPIIVPTESGSIDKDCPRPATPKPTAKWIKNVKDLWHEYAVGYTIGNVTYPPIEELKKNIKMHGEMKRSKNSILAEFLSSML
ncbi:hypothetical protein J3Q64DRAFT_1700155 [Phycomyces blakesleeanus]|uniref:Uncharacterized protein n=2 Tax=Phycomyces blakesleeanus TaxID=4837 RepID=A0ABR3AVG6_PHYBL